MPEIVMSRSDNIRAIAVLHSIDEVDLNRNRLLSNLILKCQ